MLEWFLKDHVTRWKFDFALTGINHIWKYNKKDEIIQFVKIFQNITFYCMFYCIFDQINAALVNIRNLVYKY